MTRKDSRRGWYDLAGTMLGLGGFFNGFEGLGVLIRKEYFVEADLLYGDLQFWGWVWLIVGVVQIGTAIALFDGRGRIMGMLLAGASAITAFVSLGAAPLWGALIIAVSIAAIWGLARTPEPRAGRPDPSIPSSSDRHADMPPVSPH